MRRAALLAWLLLATPSSASAGTLFFDDFSDGSVDAAFVDACGPGIVEMDGELSLPGPGPLCTGTPRARIDVDVAGLVEAENEIRVRIPFDRIPPIGGFVSIVIESPNQTRGVRLSLGRGFGTPLLIISHDGFLPDGPVGWLILSSDPATDPALVDVEAIELSLRIGTGTDLASTFAAYRLCGASECLAEDDPPLNPLPDDPDADPVSSEIELGLGWNLGLGAGAGTPFEVAIDEIRVVPEPSVTGGTLAGTVMLGLLWMHAQRPGPEESP